MLGLQAVLAVQAVLCMLCSLARTGKTDLHLGVSRLEQCRKQHEVIILAPHHIPLLIVIKNSLQKSGVMQNQIAACATARMFCGTD